MPHFQDNRLSQLRSTLDWETVGLPNVSDSATRRLERDVAVKIVRVRRGHVVGTRPCKRPCARTSHPNVVLVLSLEHVTKIPYSETSVDGIVMELLEGTTLAERLRATKALPPKRDPIGAAVASGIAHIHERAIEQETCTTRTS